MSEFFNSVYPLGLNINNYIKMHHTSVPDNFFPPFLLLVKRLFIIIKEIFMVEYEN